MLTLFLVFCLSQDPTQCIERRQEIHAYGAGLLTCMMQAQPRAAEYVEAHPKYRLTAFRCQIGNRRQEPV